MLADLDREAPAATAGITMVIGQARGTHARDGEAASMRDDAYQRLSDELAGVAASRRGLATTRR